MESLRSDDPGHEPVLAAEVDALCAPKTGECAVDLTAGRGGHACLLAARIGPAGTLALVDLDPENLAFAADRVRLERRRCDQEPPRILTFRGSFVDAPHRLEREGIRADVVLADLGYASVHVDDPARGFSLQVDGPLDMRYDAAAGSTRPTAADLVARLPESELADVIFHLGEEPYARRIARKIAAARACAPITRTSELARLVLDAYGARAKTSRMHPATRTFMALRIAVNEELDALDALLALIRRGAVDPVGWLAPGARIGIIAFHSLEDRPVKRSFAGLVKEGLATALTRKPVQAGEEERRRNPRSRSARLRVIRLRQDGVARPSDRTG